MRPRICLIGSGNVATHLGCALARSCDIIQIYSHNIVNAGRLAARIGVDSYTDNLIEIRPDADFYLVSVKDDAIEYVARCADVCSGVWAHTSGSVPMSIFAPYKKHYGVFYPLQTFSRDLDVDVRQVPFFIEGSDVDTEQYLAEVAHTISDCVRPADSALRKKLHVAAVFACNFVNLMWIEADELLRESGLVIEFLRPMLQETLRKI